MEAGHRRQALIARRSARRNLSVLAVAVVAALTFALTAEAAFPRLLMIHGSPLPRPLVVDNPFDVAKVFEGVREPADDRNLQGRPYFELTLFWGEVWNRYMEEGKPVSALKPEDVTPFANIPIHGRFYPACLGAPAVITLTEGQSKTIHSITRISDAGLKILDIAGVPVKAGCKTP